MTVEKDKGGGQGPAAAKRPAGHPGRDSRQDRLKRALRENLKRRKSRERGRSDPALGSSHAGNVSPYDDGGKKPDG
jgi:hypothetical protein